jgi:hypothetical protein
MKIGVFWDVTLCVSCKNHVSEERSASLIRVTRIVELGKTLAVSSNLVFLRSVRLLLVTASVFPSSRIQCHPDEGGANSLRNVGSYKSHTA